MLWAWYTWVMSEGTNKGQVVEFPGGEDSFAWVVHRGLMATVYYVILIL